MSINIYNEATFIQDVLKRFPPEALQYNRLTIGNFKRLFVLTVFQLRVSSGADDFGCCSSKSLNNCKKLSNVRVPYSSHTTMFLDFVSASRQGTLSFSLSAKIYSLVNIVLFVTVKLIKEEE